MSLALTENEKIIIFYPQSPKSVNAVYIHIICNHVGEQEVL